MRLSSVRVVMTVVDVDLDDLSYELLQAGLHRALVCGSSVLQHEGHHLVTEYTVWCDERRLLLIFDFPPDLLVAGVGIQEG